jgi:hypothetical protein
LLAVQMVSLVGELRRFIVTQEVDLVARDQAALHTANQAAAARKVAGVGATEVPPPSDAAPAT